jgi:hypothetical protein
MIYKILTTNDREQYKDNNNNDSSNKYLQPNNDNILDLPNSIMKTFLKHLQITKKIQYNIEKFYLFIINQI